MKFNITILALAYCLSVASTTAFAQTNDPRNPLQENVDPANAADPAASDLLQATMDPRSRRFITLEALSGHENPLTRQALQFILMSQAENEELETVGTGEAMLGVHVRKADETLRSQLAINGEFGLVIEHVTPDSAAHVAELRSHDLLYSIDEQILINVEQLHALIDSHEPGDKVELEYFRAGQSEKITITLTERQAPQVDATRDLLMNYHQQLFLNRGVHDPLNPHSVESLRIHDCRACHATVDNSTTALDAIRFTDFTDPYSESKEAAPMDGTNDK